MAPPGGEGSVPLGTIVIHFPQKSAPELLLGVNSNCKGVFSWCTIPKAAFPWDLLHPHPVVPTCPCLVVSLPDPFSMPDLSFPTDMKNVPLFPGHAEAARDILGELLLSCLSSAGNSGCEFTRFFFLVLVFMAKMQILSKVLIRISPLGLLYSYWIIKGLPAGIHGSRSRMPKEIICLCLLSYTLSESSVKSRIYVL